MEFLLIQETIWSFQAFFLILILKEDSLWWKHFPNRSFCSAFFFTEAMQYWCKGKLAWDQIEIRPKGFFKSSKPWLAIIFKWLFFAWTFRVILKNYMDTICSYVYIFLPWFVSYGQLKKCFCNPHNFERKINLPRQWTSK